MFPLSRVRAWNPIKVSLISFIAVYFPQKFFFTLSKKLLLTFFSLSLLSYTSLSLLLLDDT
jgi:hypothetical protein